jgi:hypothetical protein
MGRVRKELTLALRMVGTWDIVSSPDFDDDYLNEEETPYVELHKERDRIVGEYRFAYSSGTLDGHPQPDGSLLLSFEGMDEMDEVHGAGTAKLQDDRLVLTLMYHQGNDYTFEATRRS